jgi:hypothetical protein
MRKISLLLNNYFILLGAFILIFILIRSIHFVDFLNFSTDQATSSIKVLDILRNNVLVSEFYAKDIKPDAPKTAEISRLARLLTRSFN